jgi:hypothetical protein
VVGAFPDLGSVAERLEASSEISSSVNDGQRTVPGRKSRGEEKGVFQPRILEPKACRPGNFSGGSDEEGKMVGGGTREGGEGGVGKSQIPCLIEKGSVEAGEGGRFTFVRPSVQTIEQGQLEKSKRADGVVESVGEREVEIGIVFVGGAAEEVEISNDHPWKILEERAEALQFFQEERREGVVRRSVNIRHNEGERRKGGRKNSRERERNGLFGMSPERGTVDPRR